MQGPISKTTASFAEPFRIPGLDELLPAGDYDLETEIAAPPDHLDPAKWTASVLVRLHPRQSHPGLNRTLTVPLSALDHALARDKLTGCNPVDFFIEEMLGDPMVRLVMRADRVSEAEIRHLHGRIRVRGQPVRIGGTGGRHDQNRLDRQDAAAIQVAENEGMPTRAPRAYHPLLRARPPQQVQRLRPDRGA